MSDHGVLPCPLGESYKTVLEEVAHRFLEVVVRGIPLGESRLDTSTQTDFLRYLPTSSSCCYLTSYRAISTLQSSPDKRSRQFVAAGLTSNVGLAVTCTMGGISSFYCAMPASLSIMLVPRYVASKLRVRPSNTPTRLNAVPYESK